MICLKCNIDKPPEDFYFYPERKIRKATCRICENKRRREHYVGEADETQKKKITQMKDLLAEIIESCECRNSRRLKICIEKAKLEIGRHYNPKVGGGY